MIKDIQKLKKLRKLRNSGKELNPAFDKYTSETLKYEIKKLEDSIRMK